MVTLARVIIGHMSHVARVAMRRAFGLILEVKRPVVRLI